MIELVSTHRCRAHAPLCSLNGFVLLVGAAALFGDAAVAQAQDGDEDGQGDQDQYGH